jgi:hypothetical protein
VFTSAVVQSPISTIIETAASTGVKFFDVVNVNSTATVTGTTVKIGQVRSGTINSTASMGGTVGTSGTITPAPILSTATMGGTVARSPRAQLGLIYLWDSGSSAGGVVPISPSGIVSSATVTGLVREIVSLVPAGIQSKATVGGEAGTYGGIRSTASVSAVLFNTNVAQGFVSNPAAVMLLLLSSKRRN